MSRRLADEMRASDELDAVLRTAETLAARESPRRVTLIHLADALLRSAQGTTPGPGAGPAPEWSPAAAGATERAMEIAASESGQVAERRHLAAALAEIIRFRDMVTGAGPFIDRLPERNPDGGFTYYQEATTKFSAASVRERDPDEPG